MFTTALLEFNYSPVIDGDHIVKNRVVLTGTLRWVADFGTAWSRPVTVPAGFQFDLASAPWWLGGFIQKLGRHQRAACLHDYLYRHKIVSRRWADRQFRLAMAQDKTAPWLTWSVWVAVRLLGWRYW